MRAIACWIFSLIFDEYLTQETGLFSIGPEPELLLTSLRKTTGMVAKTDDSGKVLAQKN